MTAFTAYDFIRKWKPVALTERSAAQQHFLDLCRLFGHPTPVEDDPAGERFTFEKGVSKTGGGDGFADVWKRGFFAWEYKKKKRDLGKALEQLTRYAAALQNPPLHVACDTHIFRIETRWTNEVPKTYEFELEDLAESHNFETLRRVFHEPEKLRSGRTRATLTKEAADKFQSISDLLQGRHPDREAVAHFVNQLVFCFFADSVGLLPEGLWRKLLRSAEKDPRRSKAFLQRLFDAMAIGDFLDFEELREFNGGLFDGRAALELQHNEVAILLAACNLSWSLIDPTIFGTLFERFLDPDKRAQIGAHYTDPDKIKLIIDPVIVRPLEREWAAAKAEIAEIMAPVMAERDGGGRAQEKKFKAAQISGEIRRDAFVERLTKLRILDPACGSGNFLYLALQAVKDIEYRALLEAETLGLGLAVPRVGPEILRGIEINPFAAELARTTVWIGDIQWRVKNVVINHPRPILKNLNTIECRDALLNPDGTEAQWPEVDFIVGNPPFLGSKKLIGGLGETYANTLRHAYEGRVPGFCDLVCWWFDKARDHIVAGKAKRAGLVATNSIRGGVNRTVLDAISRDLETFSAWADEGWTVEGAAVRVSIVCFAASGSETKFYLDGKPTAIINQDLTAGSVTEDRNLTLARRLAENSDVGFVGTVKAGEFDIGGAQARQWLAEPINPNGRSNSDVLTPWYNTIDVVRRPRDSWVIDFDSGIDESQASFFERPFKQVSEVVRPNRQLVRRATYKNLWWRFAEPCSRMRRQIARHARYIATPTVAKHRIFVWLEIGLLPDHQLIAIARDDDTTFGVLHSCFHEAWSLRLGTSLEDRPRYTPTTTFETFPFPSGLTPNIPASAYADDPRAQRIAKAAQRLDQLRRNWLNPRDLVDVVPEITPTAAPGEAPRRYPDRILPKNAEAAQKLKVRTLTNLYNERPHWLADAHDALDRAVASAYGWPEDIALDDALARLLALNLERAAK